MPTSLDLERIKEREELIKKVEFTLYVDTNKRSCGPKKFDDIFDLIEKWNEVAEELGLTGVINAEPDTP